MASLDSVMMNEGENAEFSDDECLDIGGPGESSNMNSCDLPALELTDKDEYYTSNEDESSSEEHSDSEENKTTASKTEAGDKPKTLSTKDQDPPNKETPPPPPQGDVGAQNNSNEKTSKSSENPMGPPQQQFAEPKTADNQAIQHFSPMPQQGFPGIQRIVPELQPHQGYPSSAEHPSMPVPQFPGPMPPSYQGPSEYGIQHPYPDQRGPMQHYNGMPGFSDYRMMHQQGQQPFYQHYQSQRQLFPDYPPAQGNPTKPNAQDRCPPPPAPPAMEAPAPMKTPNLPAVQISVAPRGSAGNSGPKAKKPRASPTSRGPTEASSPQNNSVAETLARRGITVTQTGASPSNRPPVPKIPAIRPPQQTSVPKQPRRGQKVCNICDKSFNNNTAFTAHMKTHSSPPNQDQGNSSSPLKCNICAVDFPSVQVLQAHKAAHHPSTFQCTYCRAEYPTLQALQTHKATYHEGNSRQNLALPLIDLSVPGSTEMLRKMGIQLCIPVVQEMGKVQMSLSSSHNQSFLGSNVAVLGSARSTQQ